jgi:hypothetical protein
VQVGSRLSSGPGFAEPVVTANATQRPFSKTELVRSVADQLTFGGTGILVVNTLVEQGGVERRRIGRRSRWERLQASLVQVE